MGSCLFGMSLGGGMVISGRDNVRCWRELRCVIRSIAIINKKETKRFAMQTVKHKELQTSAGPSKYSKFIVCFVEKGSGRSKVMCDKSHQEGSLDR